MIVALNNKCNLTKEEFSIYKNALKNVETEHKMILCPSSIYLNSFEDKKISLAAQNVGCDEPGAHTGEISAEQLKSLNVEYCIVGHSERRQDQKESNFDINKKVKRLISNGITPILCVGETKEEREEGRANEIILEELEVAFKDLLKEDRDNVLVAYEPIWAIGTGLIPTTDEINEVLGMIKENYPVNKVLYGGSANEKNIDELKQCSLIDGYLLGGLSLKPEKLQDFVKKM